MKKIIVILCAAMFFALGACENEVEPGQTAVMKLSNEWWIHLLVEDGSGGFEDIYHLGYHKFMTHSTSSGTADSLFLDDFGNGAEIKSKVWCDVNSLTFSTNGEAVVERYTDETVTITNGKVLIGQGHSTSGVQVDSIYFEAEFSWDPGQKYILAGHGRTGFEEDEH